jgi:hypothetical protein
MPVINLGNIAMLITATGVGSLAVGCTSDLYDRSMTFKLNKVS